MVRILHDDWSIRLGELGYGALEDEEESSKVP